MRTRVALVLLALLGVAALGGAPAIGQDPVVVVIQGPSAVAPGSLNLYTITVTGGPAADNGTFEISYVVQGDNTVGADPIVPALLSNREGRFEVNISAPEAEGRVELFVRASSIGELGNESGETRFAMDVLTPIELRTTLRNNGAAAAENVDVRFFVDGNLVGNTSVARLGPGAQTEVSITFIPVGIGIGRHTVKVEADLDGDGVISPERGELLASEFFYKSEETNLPAILGTITVFIVSILVLVLLAIRRQRRLG